MNFVFFIFGIIFLFWSIYEIFSKESTFPKQIAKEDNPRKYWIQVISLMIVGLLFLIFYIFQIKII